MGTDLYPLAFVTGTATGLVLGPYAHKVARIETNYARSRANAIRLVERSEALLAAAQARINRR